MPFPPTVTPQIWEGTPHPPIPQYLFGFYAAAPCSAGPRRASLACVDPANKTVKTPYRTDLLPIANSATNNEQLQFQGTSEKFA
jgi:hypothetical protein